MRNGVNEETPQFLSSQATLPKLKVVEPNWDVGEAQMQDYQRR